MEKINFEGYDYVRAWCSYLYTILDDDHHSYISEKYYEYKNGIMHYVGKSYMNGDFYEVRYTKEYLNPLREFYISKYKREYKNKRRRLRRELNSLCCSDEYINQKLTEVKEEHLRDIKTISRTGSLPYPKEWQPKDSKRQ